MRVLLLASLGALAAGESQKVAPIQKVIGLLQDYAKKAKEDMHAEQVAYAKFNQWCNDYTAETTETIAKNKEDIETSTAMRDDAQTRIETFTQRKTEHEQDVGVWSDDKSTYYQVRKIEKDNFRKTHTDYSQSIRALTDAIAVVRKQQRNRKQASLLQLTMESKPQTVKQIVSQFLQQSPGKASGGEVHGYENQGMGVVSMLEKLKDKFVDERRNLEKNEADAQHEYETSIQDLTNDIDNANTQIASLSQRIGEANMDFATASSDLQDYTQTLADNQLELKDTQAACKAKSTDFKARQKLRGEELVAIAKAIDILKSARVEGHAETHAGLLQVSNLTPEQEHAAAYLRKKAKMIHSDLLSQVATRVGGDIFKKVRQMIRDLLNKLREEANEEATQKGWCDTELATNEQTRSDLDSKEVRVTGEVDTLKANLVTRNLKIESLQVENKNLAKSLKELTTQRDEEKFDNEMTIRDAKEGQDGVTRAITVLKEFYEGAGETVLTQAPSKNMPDTWSADSPLNTDAASGILGMMQTILEDFIRLAKDTQLEEDMAQKAFEEEKGRIEMITAENETSLKNFEEQVAKMNSDLKSAEEDLDATKKARREAYHYFDQLKPKCVAGTDRHEDQVKRREEEIASLEDALNILEGNNVA
jgi:chromosome segregation ATPase